MDNTYAIRICSGFYFISYNLLLYINNMRIAYKNITDNRIIQCIYIYIYYKN